MQVICLLAHPTASSAAQAVLSGKMVTSTKPHTPWSNKNHHLLNMNVVEPAVSLSRSYSAPEVAHEQKNTQRKRRRVQFGGSGSSLSSSDRIYRVESCKDMTKSEKQQLWVQHEDFQVSAHRIRQTFHGQGANNNKAANQELPVYQSSLLTTYTACCECPLDSEGIPASVSSQQLQLLGTSRGDNRGLESCAVPDLAAERSQKRKQQIQNVVALHQRLRGIPGEAQLLRSVAQDLSRPSRKFAQTMGVGDSLAALLEYSNEEDQAPKTSSFCALKSSKGSGQQVVGKHSFPNEVSTEALVANRKRRLSSPMA